MLAKLATRTPVHFQISTIWFDLILHSIRLRCAFISLWPTISLIRGHGIRHFLGHLSHWLWLVSCSVRFCDGMFVLLAKITYWVDGRLTERSHHVSKPRDLGLDFSNRCEIWQAPRQYCRYPCQITQRYEHFYIQSHGFKTSRDLAVKRSTALWIEPQSISSCFTIIYCNTGPSEWGL